MSPALRVFVVFVSAALIAGLATPLARKLALRLDIVARPNPDVPTHREVIPLLGGMALVVALLPELVFVSTRDRRWLSVGAAMGLLCALGAYKDWVERPVNPLAQLGVQAAALAMMCGAFNPTITGRVWVDYPAVLVLSLVILNAWNFIDIMDGLAGGVAAVAAATFMLACLHRGMILSAGVSAALAGACLGYLPYNWPPARIFMGDIGSFGVGCVTVALIMSGLQPGGHPVPLALALASFPLLDFTFTVVSRLLKKRSPLQGGDQHLPLRLTARGWTHARVNLFAYSLAAGSGALAWWLTTASSGPPRT